MDGKAMVALENRPPRLTEVDMANTPRHRPISLRADARSAGIAASFRSMLLLRDTLQTLPRFIPQGSRDGPPCAMLRIARGGR